MTKKHNQTDAKQRAQLDKLADGLMVAVREKFDDAIAVFPKMPGSLVVNRGVFISVGDATRLLEHLRKGKA
jgi:hypothetical protein